MTRWEVSFTLNHQFSDIELPYWLDLFNSPSCKVTEVRGSYWLAACRFEKLDDIAEVRESARKLITMMAAFAKIELGTDYQSIGQDEDEDFTSAIREHVGETTNVNVFAKTATAYAFGNPAKIVIKDKYGNVLPQPRQERWYDDYLDQCDEKISDEILRVFAYFARQASWYNLYKILELILWDVDKKSENKAKEKIINNGWIDERKLDDFTYAANYYDLLVKTGAGNVYLDESRHGEGNFQRKSKGKPIRTDIMHKPEAKNVIGDLIRNWLKFKIISI
jgi:hypothetical protein